MKKYFICYFVFVILLSACSSTRKEQIQLPCMDNNYKSFTLRWGEYVLANETYRGYQIDIYGNLFYYVNEPKLKEPKLEGVTKLEPQEVCKILEQANRTILSTQALFSPGERSHFIEYVIPEANVYIRGVWNPIFSTKGSKKYRELFDELMKTIPSASQIR